MPSSAVKPATMLAEYLNSEDAAIYIGTSTYNLRKMRKADTKRLERSEPIVGPRWCRHIMSGYYSYRQQDLDAWLAASRPPAA